MAKLSEDNDSCNTSLDQFIKIYEDDSKKKFKNRYYMTKEELAEYGKFIDNYLTEISGIM